MTDPIPLSPAADAILDVYMNNCGWLDGPIERDYRCAAAVLRAAADHLPSSAMYPSCDWGYGWRTGISDAKQKLRAIAAELKSASG